MKHAVLIMAHKNKEQLIRLIKSLACGSLDIFVHPDKKWKLSAEDLSDITDCADNVFLCTKRIHGELDKWSLVETTLNLIDDAIKQETETGEKYSYFLLLSGQDYPIKSKEYILSFLEKQYPFPLIHIESYDDEYWVRSKFMLTRWLNKVEAVHKSMKPGLLRKLRVSPYVILEKIEHKFYGSTYERLKKYNLNIYGGSAWWILPHGLIDYISEVRKKQPKLIKEYRRTHTPEETFFQTMTMTSPFAEYLKDGYPPIYDNSQRGDMPCMTYANFITPKKGFCGHPHIITSEDFNRIMAKKALFARKFDAYIDSEVLDMIDEKITPTIGDHMCKISIIVPAHNATDTIDRCIKSVLGQDFKDWEMILVNDVPADLKGKQTYDSYAKKDPRIKCIHLPNNVSISEARNIGIANAKGEYICFMDSDDEIAAGALNNLLKAAQKTNADIAVGSKTQINIAEKTQVSAFACDDDMLVLNRKNIVDLCLTSFFENEGLNYLGRWNLQSCLFKSDFLKNSRVKFNAQQLYGEDARFMLEAYSVANGAVFTRVPFHIYYYDSSAVSKKYANRYERSIVEAFAYQEKIIKENNLPKKCLCNLAGKTFVGINATMLILINREKSHREIRKFVYTPCIRKCLIRILFMSNKNMIYAEVSNNQRITAFLYLLGVHKKGLLFEQSKEC